MKYPVVCGKRTRGLLWVRVFGWGVHVRDVRVWSLMFSEREGYANYLMIRGFVVKGLRP